MDNGAPKFAFPSHPPVAQRRPRPPRSGYGAGPRESNALRASVLDAALEIGLVGDGGVNGWMLENKVLEEEEEPSSPAPARGTTERVNPAPTNRPYSPFSSSAGRSSAGEVYTPALSAGPSAPASPALRSPVSTSGHVDSPPSGSGVQFPHPPPPIPNSASVLAAHRPHKLRKRSGDGYESEGGYVSDGGGMRAKSKSKKKKKKGKDGAEGDEDEGDEDEEQHRTRKKSLLTAARRAVGGGGSMDDPEAVARARERKDSKAAKKEAKKAKKSASSTSLALAEDEATSVGGYVTDGGGTAKKKPKRGFFSALSGKGSKGDLKSAKEDVPPVPQLMPVLTLALEGSSSGRAGNTSGMALPIAERFATTFGPGLAAATSAREEQERSQRTPVNERRAPTPLQRYEHEVESARTSQFSTAESQSAVSPVSSVSASGSSAAPNAFQFPMQSQKHSLYGASEADSRASTPTSSAAHVQTSAHASPPVVHSSPGPSTSTKPGSVMSHGTGTGSVVSYATGAGTSSTSISEFASGSARSRASDGTEASSIDAAADTVVAGVLLASSPESPSNHSLSVSGKKSEKEPESASVSTTPVPLPTLRTPTVSFARSQSPFPLTSPGSPRSPRTASPPPGAGSRARSQSRPKPPPVAPISILKTLRMKASLDAILPHRADREKDKEKHERNGSERSTSTMNGGATQFAYAYGRTQQSSPAAQSLHSNQLSPALTSPTPSTPGTPFVIVPSAPASPALTSPGSPGQHVLGGRPGLVISAPITALSAAESDNSAAARPRLVIPGSPLNARAPSPSPTMSPQLRSPHPQPLLSPIQATPIRSPSPLMLSPGGRPRVGLPRSPSPVQDGTGPTAPPNVLAYYDLPPPSPPPTGPLPAPPSPMALSPRENGPPMSPYREHASPTSPNALLGPDPTALAQRVMDRTARIMSPELRTGGTGATLGSGAQILRGKESPFPVRMRPGGPAGLPSSPAPVVRGGPTGFMSPPPQDIATPRVSEDDTPDAAMLRYAQAKKRAMEMRVALANGATPAAALSAGGGIAGPPPSLYLDMTPSVPANSGLAPPMNTRSASAKRSSWVEMDAADDESVYGEGEEGENAYTGMAGPSGGDELFDDEDGVDLAYALGGRQSRIRSPPSSTLAPPRSGPSPIPPRSGPSPTPPRSATSPIPSRYGLSPVPPSRLAPSPVPMSRSGKQVYQDDEDFQDADQIGARGSFDHSDDSHYPPSAEEHALKVNEATRAEQTRAPPVYGFMTADPYALPPARPRPRNGSGNRGTSHVHFSDSEEGHGHGEGDEQEGDEDQNAKRATAYSAYTMDSRGDRLSRWSATASMYSRASILDEDKSGEGRARLVRRVEAMLAKEEGRTWGRF